MENQAKGKLLVKIDARFCVSSKNSNDGASPSSSTNQDSPIKMVPSPHRRTTYSDNFNGGGYGGSPGIENVTSRKSDTSVYSITGSSNGGGGGGREQGIQTELSMPSNSMITHYDKPGGGGDAEYALEAARNFLRREQEAGTNRPPRCPPKGEGTGGRRRDSYQLEEGVAQVIDILNNANIEDPPRQIPRKGSWADPLHQAKILGVTKSGLPSLEGGTGTIMTMDSGGSSKRVSISSVGSSKDNKHEHYHHQRLSMDDKPLSRFKEVHFDGHRAKEQVKSLVMTRHTAGQGQSQGQTQGPPVVTRRRIAAAIFND